MQPNYQILANDNDITALIKAHFISLSIKDSSGLDSDTLTIVLEDAEGTMAWPRKGARLKLALGYDNNLHPKGEFIVDELDYGSPPDQLTLHCRAADLSKMGNTKKSREWGELSLGDIIKTLAQEHGLIPAISDVLKDNATAATYQIDESDLNFLARIAVLHGAIAQVKNGRLLLVPAGTKKTASGAPLPVVIVNKKDTSRHRFSERAGDEYTGISATYLVLVDGIYQRKTLTLGSDEKIKKISTVYDSKAQAQTAAQTEYNAIVAIASTLDITLSQGKPEYIAEMGLELDGFISRISDLDWVATSVTHTLNGSGLSSSIKAVRPTEYDKEFIKKTVVSTPVTPVYTGTSTGGGTALGGGSVSFFGPYS